ncbi:unnamed protein product [Symbiodinium natans]|uniref:Uncharacterized protein n=1 Tax=Symbiodinium natans TaxID=878477 RepID=A0A812MX72_9DINO|nr:unnamed protein product [Symbiodinium natans]
MPFWTGECCRRHLPLLQRPACERQAEQAREVDKRLLAESTWVRTDPHAPEGKASMTIKLDHD